MNKFGNGKKIESLLSEAQHDLVNVLNSIGVANSLIEMYCLKLLPLYDQLDENAKRALRIDTSDIELLVKNFANIKQDTYLGSLYLKSLRYNFIDYANLTIETVNIVEIFDDAKKQYNKIFHDLDNFNLLSQARQTAVSTINRDMLLNILIRFLRLGRYFNLNNISLSQTHQYNILTFAYNSPHMLLSQIVDLDDPLLHLSEMKVAFNLSLAYNYLEHIGGRVEHSYEGNRTNFMLYLNKQNGDKDL